MNLQLLQYKLKHDTNPPDTTTLIHLEDTTSTLMPYSCQPLQKLAFILEHARFIQTF